MRVAISTDGDLVSAHFGRCPTFTIIDIENGKITRKEIVDNPGHEGVNCIVAGGMGARASGLFDEFGIQPIVGISGKIDEVIEKLQKGTLEGSESLCKPGAGKGYGLDKTECNHPEEKEC
jgi:predicted Fe-Mo cluster-binding NifX family protein